MRDLYTTSDGYVSLTSSSDASGLSKGKSIVILGGSTSMGLGASSNENTIAAILQNLMTIDGYEHTVVNAACASYCSWQELIRFALEISHLKPEIVISCSGYNDFMHSSLGDKYSGEWVRNHDRSIEDLADLIINRDKTSNFRHLFNSLKRFPLINAIIRACYKIFSRKNYSAKDLVYEKDKWTFSARPWASDNYVHNMVQINSIVNGYGGNFFTFIQPHPNDNLNSNNHVGEEVRNMYAKYPDMRSAEHAFFDRLAFLIKSHDFIHESPILPAECFVDRVHLSDLGQFQMASFIYAKIRECI
ncbi:SGNH/GDSL hydrolase family protein [Synechococcus sp. A15-24]|uniref:SGNH/GDSL hydrolase family protein n=1 Tax=Synechococcus sp. A15-24 TaxID=1050635 RepID=UPI001646AE21|nr:SGNH/GDSL hydrolase family protein [Synechococcus sp. A15-24]QNJ27814.1 GDSL-like Lipase/Acylhydrolase family protein [Synechococcus sp. A15-24]